jgi:hypothetical protein
MVLSGIGAPEIIITFPLWVSVLVALVVKVAQR